MAIDLVKENIECEQLLGENHCNNVVKTEYVIPDTHPDVCDVLMLDAKPCITHKEVLQDKVIVEGHVEFNVIYLAKEEEKYVVHCANYVNKFTNSIGIPGSEHKMLCDADAYVEHMECSIVNGRKVSIEGIVTIKAEVYKNYNFEILRDASSGQDIQTLKSATVIDKIVGIVPGELVVKSQIQIAMEKPQIGTVLKCDVCVHKKDVKLLEDKVQINASALVNLLYRGKDSRDIVYIEDDIIITKELSKDGLNSAMEQDTEFRVEAMEFNIKEDDLGENRVVDVEAIIKSNTKVMSKEEMDIIEDAYSPSIVMKMVRKNYDLNVMQGQSTFNNIVKGNIEIPEEAPKPSQVIMSSGKVCVTDKKIVEDKVVVEGLLTVDILYKTTEQEKYVYNISEEMPFTTTVEIPGAKINMQCMAKVSLDSIDAAVEAGTISVKAIIQGNARVNYISKKELLSDMVNVEGEIPQKKASLIIYTMQDVDSLWKIAKKYGTTVENIMKINELDGDKILNPGEKLIIPGRMSF